MVHYPIAEEMKMAIISNNNPFITVIFQKIDLSVRLVFTKNEKIGRKIKK
jgi:hypothetical protein